MSGLTTPRLRITRTGAEPVIVRVLNPDLVRWDRYRASHRWPAADVAPMLWMTFVAWAAAKRTAAIPEDLDYPTFEETTEQIEMVDEAGRPITDADEAVPEVDPTQGAADPD